MRESKTIRWVKENVEAVAIAIVMALVIRQFAIEAFKIPTESMAPTLLGRELGGVGDRILVDKLPILLGEPDRWSILVFKYPLNASKNYIKRVVGLGGETLDIRDGDIYIDGEIARKPGHVQEELFFPVYPPPLTESRSATFFAGDSDRWERAGPGDWSVRSPDGIARLSYDRAVRDAQTWAGLSAGQTRVGDVRLAVAVTPESGRVLLSIVENRIGNVLSLAVGSGRSFVAHGDEEHDLEGVALEPGEEVEVSLANVDDALIAVVDGEEFRFTYESPPEEETDHSADAIRFGVDGGAARFVDPRIDRDIHYVAEELHRNVRIPEDHYFMLGDNSRKSKDSRRWEVQVLTLEDGTEYRHDTTRDEEDLSEMPEAGPGQEVFRDIHGLWRIVDSSRIVDRTIEDAPFVPRENLIGRAFFVFWPMNPFQDRFRLKFLR